MSLCTCITSVEDLAPAWKAELYYDNIVLICMQVFEEDSKASIAALASTMLAEVPPEPSLDHTLGEFGKCVIIKIYILYL